jgi:hypothetical protein
MPSCAEGGAMHAFYFAVLHLDCVPQCVLDVVERRLGRMITQRSSPLTDLDKTEISGCACKPMNNEIIRIPLGTHSQHLQATPQNDCDR